jgi:hypothetical protein
VSVLDIRMIARKVQTLRMDAAERDSRMHQVYSVRSNKTDEVMPGSFPDAWPKPIVANWIDVAAHQLAENLAPLPSINCASGIETSDRAKNFQAKRTKIAYSYLLHSETRKKMPTGCDHYICYGFLPIIIEPDFEEGRPRMRFDNPMGSYPQLDLFGRVVSYTKVWREEAWKLADKFPDFYPQIMGMGNGRQNECSPGSMLEVVKYFDKDQYVLYMPERSNLVLSLQPNHFGKVPVVIGFKPSYDDQTRGQFDDVIWPHMARARMALLGLQATQQTVRAPLAIPTDVQRIPFGDDAIIRTNSPEKIRRVGTDVPQIAWQQEQVLQQDIMSGSRTPPAATGQVQASVITGKGVDALNGGYDIQIATGQLILGEALREALELCFEMDVKFWPDHTKEIRGVVNGQAFEERYTPSRDIKDDYAVSVSYGFASGMNPNNALVFLLQLRGDQLVPRDFVQRQLPMDIDTTALQRQVDIEQVEDALKQGLFGMASSMGIMAQQGQDPVDLLNKMATVIEQREKGTPMHQAILAAFTPQAPPPGAAAPGGPPAPGGGPAGPGGPGGPGGGGGVPFGINPDTGMPSNVAPGQAAMGPGGRPDLMSLLAGLGSSGKPDLKASVMRRMPV